MARFGSIALVALGMMSLIAGCSSGWACGVSASGDGCFCTSDEVHTTAIAECNASVTGAPHCCDSAAEHTCSCRPAPRCWMDGDACLCGVHQPEGTISVDNCHAESGFICCMSDGLAICTCGLTECLLADDRVVLTCTASDIDPCFRGETPVNDCVTQE